MIGRVQAGRILRRGVVSSLWGIWFPVPHLSSEVGHCGWLSTDVGVVCIDAAEDKVLLVSSGGVMNARIELRLSFYRLKSICSVLGLVAGGGVTQW